MDILFILKPGSVLLGAGGLAVFIGALRTRKYEGEKGEAKRVL